MIITGRFQWLKKLFAESYTISREEADAIQIKAIKKLKPTSKETLEKLKSFYVRF